MKKFLIALFVFAIQHFKSQNIKIVDRVTRQTIPGVTAFSIDKQNSAASNSKGEIDFRLFKNADSVSFILIGLSGAFISAMFMKKSRS